MYMDTVYFRFGPTNSEYEGKKIDGLQSEGSNLQILKLEI